MSTCLDEDVVVALVEGHLDEQEMVLAEDHLDICARCHELVVDAARAIAPAWRADHIRIGPYRIEEQLGLGGSAIVYRAVDVDTSQVVALKAVEVVSQSALAAIRREIHVLKRLQHPGIIRVIDHGVDAGRPWYAMELLDRDTLADVVRTAWSVSAPLRTQAGAGQLARLLTIAHRLCEPLAFLHAEGVVHRDLKPQNVLIRRDGQPVLVDFGFIGWAPGALSRETAGASIAAGTPLYMAPEQIARQPVDARADLYAVGCMLYELISGRPPFTGTTVGEVLRQHLGDAPAPLSKLVEGVPPPLEHLVHALLAKTPHDRPGHADDVAAALEHAGAPSTRRRAVRSAYLYRPSLTGRASEVAHLVERAEQASQGRGGIVLVLGESGIGKTYLAIEAGRQMQARGMCLIEGLCRPLDSAADDQAGVLLPFRPLLEMVADRCLVLGRAGSDRLLGPRGKVLTRLLPRLAEMPGQDAYPALRETSGIAAREQLLAALRETLTRLAEDQPLILLLDDLQWADELTLRFLETLDADYFAHTRLLIMATCRSEDCPIALSGLAQRSFAHTIALGRLDDRAIRSLVVDMLAWNTPPEPWLATLVHQSDGNPFFVAEYIRAAVTEGTVRRRAGAWTAELAPPGLTMPPTLRELVQRRLRALSGAAQRLCSAAAVLGREFEIDLLQATARVDSGETLDGTAEMTRYQIAEEAADGQLRFVHHTVREVAYEAIPPEQRRLLHRAAAEAIERRHGTGATAQLARLGHHWATAGDAIRGQHFFALAGDHALSVAAYAQAKLMFSRALELHGDHGADLARLAHLRLGLGQACFGLGDLDALEHQALDALDALGWRRPDARTGWWSLLARQVALQLTHLTLGARPAPADRGPALRDGATAAGLLSQRYFYLDDLLPMTATVLLSMNCAERSRDGAPVARAYTVMGGLCGLLRARTLSERYFAKAHAAALSDGGLGERAMALAVEAVTDGSLGQWRRARTAAGRLAVWIPDIADPLIRENVITTLCHVELFAGNLAAARSWTDQLLASARASCNEQHAMWGLYFLARDHASANRWAEVPPLLADAHKALKAHPETQSEINCLGLSALASLRLGQLDQARRFTDDALARIERSRPTGFPSLAGYGAVAEVYRELAASADGDRDVLQRWRATRRALRAFAILFPVARPIAYLEAGYAAHASGRPRIATAYFALSLRTARRFAMPEAIAAAELAVQMS